MDYGLKGHVAIVTGSTSGIGLALAGALAAEGVNLVINGLGDPAAIEAERARLEQDHGVRVRHHPANMLKPDEIADLMRRHGILNGNGHDGIDSPNAEPDQGERKQHSLKRHGRPGR